MVCLYEEEKFDQLSLDIDRLRILAEAGDWLKNLCFRIVELDCPQRNDMTPFVVEDQSISVQIAQDAVENHWLHERHLNSAASKSLQYLLEFYPLASIN